MSKGTPRRSIRVGDLWEEAQQVATRRNENLSEIIRQALAQYVRDNQEPGVSNTTKVGGRMIITDGKIYAAAKTLAGFNGDAWVFEPPKMDGITRSGTDASVYLRQAEAILVAAVNSPETPVPDSE